MLRGRRGERGSKCNMWVDDDVDEMGNLTALSHIWPPSYFFFFKTVANSGVSPKNEEGAPKFFLILTVVKSQK